MPPSDKNEPSVDNKPIEGKRENPCQETVKANGTDQLATDNASSSTTDMISEHGTVTNIPVFTAKISTLKCSENDQMKTFDPGESSNNENAHNKVCGYPLKFPLKNSSSVTKQNKNYKAGSKINKLADMLAKRSQNIVEMTQNVTSDVITDIISAPKVEGNSNTVDISECNKAENKSEFSDVCCEETVSNQTVDSMVESQRKSATNENSENIKQLQSQLSHYCSNISELISQETDVSELNALKEHLNKSETEGSTKIKKEVRKNLKNVELSLILPEKKRRSSPRNRLVISELNKECNQHCYQEEKSSAKTLKPQKDTISNSGNDQTVSPVNVNSIKKREKIKSSRQRKSKRLVETSTQTSTTDFVCIDLTKSKGESVSDQIAVFSSAPKKEYETKEESMETKESPEKPFSSDTSESVAGQNVEEKLEMGIKSNTGEKSESSEKQESDSGADVKFDMENSEIEKCVYACMYCPASFVTKSQCKEHEKSHSPKKNKQVTKCQFCSKHYPSFYDLKLHCIKNHPNKYAYCVKCDERFCEKTLLYSHNKLLHLTKAMEEAQNLVKIQETLGINPREKTREEIEELRKSFDKKNSKPTGNKSDLKVDVSFDWAKKCSTSPRAVQKTSPRENKTEEQLLEMEMLFYSHLSGNIMENLTNHLDGKIDKNGNPVQTDLINDSSNSGQAKPRSTNLLSVVTASSSGTPDQVIRAPSPYQTRSKTPNPLPPTAKKFNKLPNWQQKFWEKYNFPTNYRYEHRFWDKNYLNTEKSALYLKDLSCLDIKTQLIMRENIKKLENIKSNDESNKLSDKLTFPEYLSLVPKAPDGKNQKTGAEGFNIDSLKYKCQNKDEKRSGKNSSSDFNKPRRKGSVDNSVSKKQLDKNTPKPSDGTKMMTRRRSVIELTKSSRSEDSVKRRNGSLDIPEGQKMTLRRQTSLDNLQKVHDSENNSKAINPLYEPACESNVNESEGEDNMSSSVTGFAEISGEWVRPRSYLCGTCCAKFTNLWELEDHKWVSHPNVWCTHYEFEDEKIDKLFHRSDTENADDSGSGENTSSMSKLKLTDLYKRYLLPHGSLKTAKLVPNVSFPEQCTKCKKNCMNLSEMHKHMLDCGGDTTWFLTMYSSPMTIKRKWRPFGSRRRKQIGRRVLKRNIPNAPNMRPYSYQHRIRTKPGDVESIQKMLANLPEKRARRAINFDEIKTRSQATIHSNRLLRKRFKVSFGTNIIRLKALKQQRQVKPMKKDSSSKSTTDTSSENTPTGSPKRKNKLKDNVQPLRDETLAINSNEVVLSGDSKKKCKKDSKKQKAAKEDLSKKCMKKDSKSSNNKNGKPITRSTSSGNVEVVRETSNRDRRKKGQGTETEVVAKMEIPDLNRIDKKSTADRQGKTPKKKSGQKNTPESVVKKEFGNSTSVISPRSDQESFLKKKPKTEIDDVKNDVVNNQFLQESKDTKKGKGGKLPSKNILRLKSNDKEKTELIKRIQKTLRNSKRILEKRENERRRSLRIQTLQLLDITSKPCHDISSSGIKESENPDGKQSRSTQLSCDNGPQHSVKRSSKSARCLRGSDSKLPEDTVVEDVPCRRSSRSTSLAGLDEKSELTGSGESLSVKNQTENVKKASNVCGSSLEANQTEFVETIKRCPPLDNARNSKAMDDGSNPLVGFESESVRKSERLQTLKFPREAGVESQSSKTGHREVKNICVSQELKAEKNNDSKNFDLSEMPVLDKEVPVRGRNTRKGESEIPVLMPFESEEKNSSTVSKDQKPPKRKNVVTFKVVNKRLKSSESLNPLTIVKETEAVLEKQKEALEDITKTKKTFSEGAFNENLLKKRKRGLVNEPGSDQKCSKSPKAKRYFLGICPSEIDKGGDLKDDSGSDSEPLITLVLNQKLKEKTESGRESEGSVVQPNVTEEPPPVEESKIELDSVQETKLRPRREVKRSCSPVQNDTQIISEDITDEKVVMGNGDLVPENVELLPDEPSSGVVDSQSGKSEKEVSLCVDYDTKKQFTMKKSLKGLKMTVKLKETTSKIVDNPESSLNGKWIPQDCEAKNEAVNDTIMDNERLQESVPVVEAVEETETKMERRSRRISKEIKSTNEFVIDDPLILVDELWSDLDSDSDGSRKRSKKGRKKPAKKKCYEDKKESSVNLEELLRNFGESKKTLESKETKVEAEKSPVIRKRRNIICPLYKRKQLESRNRFEEKSFRRLSLRLFKFHRKIENFGYMGLKLLNAKKGVLVTNELKPDFKSQIPVLPFLTAEIKENPVQIIQCGVQKTKNAKKTVRKSDSKQSSNIQMKISLPLQSINNLAVLNNNHLTEVVYMDSSEKSKLCKNDHAADGFVLGKEKEVAVLKEFPTDTTLEETESSANPKEEDGFEPGDSKLKSRRSEVIDKIFYCEICKTYYYSSSQLKIHKLSNRHKQKESEMSRNEERPVEEVPVKPNGEPLPEKEELTGEPPPQHVDKPICSSQIESVDSEKMNDDTSEMPILEGPFIENPFVRLGMNNPVPPPKPASPARNMYGFTEDCLKDIQRAIGCTDEEMLILTLLGENSIELESDILDLDSCQSVTSNPITLKESLNEIKERESSNGMFKMDFKKRITSALARLVNKALLNILQKYKNTNRTGISPEALTFLVKLSKMNCKKNLLELDELLKTETEGEASNRMFVNEEDVIGYSLPYKYFCSICGARFQKDSVKEWHFLRYHRPKVMKADEEPLPKPVSLCEEDKEDQSILYKYSCTICGSRFQNESTKECHIIRTHLTKGANNLEESSSSPVFPRDDEKKEQSAPYKYLCTICGSRFQKESMWECHIKRSHSAKAKKNAEEMQIAQTVYEDDWSSTWTYDINDELPGSVETPQFLCSDCGINFISPKEVLEHQKSEHAGQKDTELNESGPLQSSKIGSSDEILKGRRIPRKGPKHLSNAELDQQRIIAKNELRKLDRKLPNKNKTNRIRWGMDALKFTVEKENKAVPEQEEKENPVEESPKPQIDPKNIDIVPKLNLSRTNNIPEFKVVQKTSCLSRFQRLLNNKMKRKTTRSDGKEVKEKPNVEKVFAEPVAILKKEKKKKPIKNDVQKNETRKIFDIYDFNDSESEPEPMAFSHVKKGGPTPSPTKLKLVKVKDGNETSKNKADSTTKDLETEDYDSEDSLPLSVVKRTKAEEEDEEVREKPEGILEQVEYLIEQLENETNNPKSENITEKTEEKVDSMNGESKSPEEKKEPIKQKLDPDLVPEESVESQPETFRVSLENKFLQLESIATKRKDQEIDENTLESQGSLSLDSVDKVDEVTAKSDDISPVADSSQGISDEEDSLPLVLMSKKPDLTICNTVATNSEKVSLTNKEPFTREEAPFSAILENEEKVPFSDNVESPKMFVDSLPMLSSNEPEEPSEKSEKSFETLNGNVIYRRNDSMSGFDSDTNDYDVIDSNADKTNVCHEESENLIKEVMEKEDVVIVCSKKEQDVVKTPKKKLKESPKRKKQSVEIPPRKKKILPLLSVTLEENSFRKSESPKLKKDVIMKKIWSRRRFPEDGPDENSENSIASHDNEIPIENLYNDDSHSEIDKEIIMKKIWNKKRMEHEGENGDVLVTKLGGKPEDLKINQTEISDEVVIKCGPKAKATPKRRKSRTSTKESSKDRIMRKIWSGKCTFQTKAALKTYDSDILRNSKESDALEEQNRAKKRGGGRSSNFLNSKKPKVLSEEEKSDEDDLDSLLEEIEQEEVEKAIRLEFLQLRRSDKANVEVSKECGNMTVGLFAETCHRQGRDLTDRKRKRIRKNIKHPRKTLLKRRKFIKKPTVKSQPSQPQQQQEQQQQPQQQQQQPAVQEEEQGETQISGSVDERLRADSAQPEVTLGTNLESKIKNRKHKKHRHKHHHHKHKHKKSKHHKYIVGKHKMKHKSSAETVKEAPDEFENFSILEKMCQDIPNQIEKQSQRRFELESLDTKLDEVLMSTSSSFDSKTKECDDVFYEGRGLKMNRSYGIESASVYEFDEEDSGFLGESKADRC